ncbi:flagellar biosynthesis protein FlhF [Herminiimonas sp. CN]|uniref:flagellar biosynthesis protein FlhF n=1 Tax=Herminiimonas sp. CN TaxID=1349818 RepID=UPI0004732148|nr:flagellar biosynthesis protein FlhF [Herminiimonas sp. CN]
MNTSTNVSTKASKVIASSSREALRLIREKLGPDAIILSNRVTAAGVEIVAIAEDAAAQISVSTLSAATPIAVPVLGNPAAPQAAEATRPQAADSLLSEIHSMRGMIEEQLAGLVWSDKQRRDPVRSHLLRALLGAGFSARLAKAMLDHLPTGQSYTNGMEWVKSELARNLPLLENEDALMEGGGVYALMGPTGVGKTTTTAKLAARCVMRFGSEKLALVTTDSYRIGAYEQLRIYGQILGVSVHAVKDAVDLRLVLNDLRDKHMVLIDTVGMSQRDRTVSDQIAMLCGAGRPVRRLLLLNASSHGDTLNEVVQAYRYGTNGADGNDLAGCIFTKVDEATHPGTLLDTVIRHRLPVYYVSSGQKVPENLMIADRGLLVDSAFQAGSRSALFIPGEADLGEQPALLSNDAETAAIQASSQAATERLRVQCRKLIRALTHDAQELNDNADALAAGQIGFDGTRALWRNLTDDAVNPQAVAQTLLTQACAEVDVGCDQYVLALGGKVSLSAEESGDTYALHGSLLLSDRSGMPLAAPNQLLTTVVPSATKDGAHKSSMAEMRQFDWLQRQDFGRPMIHLLENMPTATQIHDWQTGGVRWLARSQAGAGVVDMTSGVDSTLAKLADTLSFGTPQSVVYKGKAALQTMAETSVSLRSSAKNMTANSADPIPSLRCVMTRIVEKHSGKLLAKWYLLGNIEMQVTAQQIVQWHHWRAAVEPYFKLLKHGINQLGGCGQPGDVNMLKRLLIAGQVCATAWRLQHVQGDWAEPARKLLAQLSGHPSRLGRAVPGSVLFEGMGKLYVLLDALDADGSAMPPQAPDLVTVQD